MRVDRMAVTVGLGLWAATGMAADTFVLKDQRDKVSYSIGLSIGKDFKQKAIDANVEAMARGIKDGLTGQALLSEAEVRAVLTTFQTEIQAKLQQQARTEGDKNKREGASFLAANARKPGVKTLPSGLQYKVLANGKGPTPKATDTVETNYRGTFIDNTEFDSSAKHGQTATFPVTGVIKGWTEALQLMKVGSKWQLYVPAELAYGEGGMPPVIGPNATLIFDIELLGIK